MSKRPRKLPNVVAWSERDIVAALMKRYPPPEWAFFPQARSGTGHSQLPRTADAVAMNLWPSRGMEVHGFEVKVNRTDFLAELKEPEKADSIARYCDRWWLAIAGGYGDGETGIVRPGELPAAWGLLALRFGHMQCLKEAPKLDPVPLDRAFVASLLRNQAECPIKEDEKKYQDRYMEGVEYGKQVSARESEHLREAVRKFQEASGIDVGDEWTAGNVVKAVKVLVDMRHDIDAIARAQEAAQGIADGLKSLMAESGLALAAEDMDEDQA